MEEAADERNRRRAIETLAATVRQLAEWRHFVQEHAEPFERCDEACCANAREAYMVL